MNGNICLPKSYFLIIFIVILSFAYMDKIKQILPSNNLPNNSSNNDTPSNNDNIIYRLPIRQLLENRDRSVLSDPLVAPERRIDVDQYPIRIQDEINIPSRGYPDNYQLMGIASRESDENIVQLFGRATFPGSNQYEYYITTNKYGFNNKIPIVTKGKKEIMDSDIIDIPEFDQSKGSFKVKIYDYNTPRYNPYIL